MQLNGKILTDKTSIKLKSYYYIFYEDFLINLKQIMTNNVEIGYFSMRKLQTILVETKSVKI